MNCPEIRNPVLKCCIYACISAVCIVLMPVCRFLKEKEPRKIVVDLPQIKERKEITAITLNTSTSYFIYRMQQMGYEYELIRGFADSLGVELPIGFPRRASWIVRKESPEPAQAINKWAAGISKSPVLRTAVKRYFELSKDEDFSTEGSVIKKGTLSPYDDLFKKHAAKIGWDWQLLASIAYQESKFHNHLESWAGAKGLMGIMPSTARSLGFSPDSLANPETSVIAGVKCLMEFSRYFASVKDSSEHIKFTLAAYNAGNGHIADARRLALKYGRNPDLWEENVAEYIRLKSEPEYYNDPVCNHGYLRGVETFGYVREVISRYRLYKSMSKPAESKSG